MPSPVISLESGQTTVVGYGLMLSRQTVLDTVGYDYDGPFARCYVKGWRRTWEASIPNRSHHYRDAAGRKIVPERFLFLNVRRDPSAELNAVAFVLDQNQLAAMDRRESGYERLDVTGRLRGLRVIGGRAVMYAARSGNVATRFDDPTVVAIRRSYVDALARVVDCLSEEDRLSYERSTDSVRSRLIVDDQHD